ncbi:hypothetical protein CCR75_000513 [Bremia lactucae]|uniref:Uncharacterized protein n=1 Tax=Bremia lactucae TaxID=4779 RepID=A0A976NZ27_BRELC|nr:hypothetical protein CCR75_000513 [Bremia lactucae]
MSEAHEEVKAYYDTNRKLQEFAWDKRKSSKKSPRLIQNCNVKRSKIHPVFHTSLLKPYRKDDNRRQQANKVLLADGKQKDNLSKPSSATVVAVAKNNTRSIDSVSKEKNATWESELQFFSRFPN